MSNVLRRFVGSESPRCYVGALEWQDVSGEIKLMLASNECLHGRIAALERDLAAARAERDAAVRRAEELEGVLDSITDQAVMTGKMQTELLHKASKLLCK